MHLGERLERRRGRDSSLLPMYWNIFLRGLGVAMMGLFTPVFIFLIGKEGGVVEGLRLVLVYLFLQRLGIFLLATRTGKIVARLGFRNSLLLGSVFLILYYLVPAIWGGEVWVVYVMAFLSVWAIPFYWLARHSILSMDGKRKRRGKETGMMALLDRGAAILSPVVGGFILGLFGFRVLFILGGVIVLFSSLPPFFMSHHKKDGEISWKSFVTWSKDKSNKHRVRGFWGESWEGVISAFFWPIYIYLVVGSFQVLGGMISTVLLVSSLMVFLAGKMFDKQRSKGGLEDEKAYWFAGGLVAALRVMRAVFASFWGVFGLDMVTKIISPYYRIPFTSYIYSMGENGKTLKIYVYRSIVYSLGIVILSLCLWWLVVYEWRWWAIFGMNAVGVLLTLSLARES